MVDRVRGKAKIVSEALEEKIKAGDRESQAKEKGEYLKSMWRRGTSKKVMAEIKTKNC